MGLLWRDGHAGYNYHLPPLSEKKGERSSGRPHTRRICGIGGQQREHLRCGCFADSVLSVMLHVKVKPNRHDRTVGYGSHLPRQAQQAEPSHPRVSLPTQFTQTVGSQGLA